VKSITLYLAILLSGISFQAKSQDVFTQEWQAWFRYYNQARLSEKITFNTELDDRARINPWSQFQFFSQFHLHYRAKAWLDVAAGTSYAVTNPSESLTITEWRPWQEVSLFKKIGKDAMLQFRYRLDERFIHRNDEEAILDTHLFNWRHRFRIQLGKPIAEFNNHSFILKISDEVMFNSGDVIRTFDQNQFTAALEFKINDHWSYENSYVNIFQPISDHVFRDRHVIRTTVYHRIDIRKNRG
jgi:Protein of unknown function (DUF2490)